MSLEYLACFVGLEPTCKRGIAGLTVPDQCRRSYIAVVFCTNGSVQPIHIVQVGDYTGMKLRKSQLRIPLKLRAGPSSRRALMMLLHLGCHSVSNYMARRLQRSLTSCFLKSET